jgi:hypothetical protein
MMISALIYLVIYIVVIGLVVGLLLWLIDNVPLMEPFNRIARVAIIVLAVLIVILLLLNFIGVLSPPPRLGVLMSKIIGNG